ncbi:MAG: D-2-hydroxyacid dehydrogenase [Gammaproteobacteria bacterium]
MRAVFLDYATVDAGDLDPQSLHHAVGALTLYPATAPDAIAERLRGADVALINKIRLGREQLDALPDLKMIALAATGSDNVDLIAARERGIAVANIRDYCTPSVAQHVVALILTLARRLDRYRALVSSGAWRAPEPFCLLDEPIVDLDGRTLGIIGYGSLARGVESITRAMGMRTLIAQRVGTAPSPDRVSLDELYARADVISLHCPLNDTTRGMIDATALSKMRPSALLINTARGGLIDGAALVEALRAGEIAGAGIDVLPQEPPPDDEPLLSSDVPNLIVTPHVAWASVRARQQALEEMAQNIAAFGAGKPRNRIEG